MPAAQPPARADESLVAEEHVLVEVKTIERGVHLTKVVADVGKGERCRGSTNPAQRLGLEVRDVTVDVACIQRSHCRPNRVDRPTGAHGVAPFCV